MADTRVVSPPPAHIQRTDLGQLAQAIQRVLEAPNSSVMDVRTLRSLVEAKNMLVLEVQAEWW